ncbi:MAG: hypothetical protein U1B30_15990 [Pseudomonadota bacterium]|nr:hypothetical protein [Pseudomonadota bacterium]
MANDVVAIEFLYPACVAELEDRLVPVNYRELTSMALARLGVSRETVNWNRQVEDVRERFADCPKHKDGAGYTGPPSFLAFLNSWIRTEAAPHLFNNDKPIVIESNFPSSEEACFEALMREPYMMTKTSTSRERRIRGLARGMLIQHHVCHYFRSRWPAFYVPPENEGKWTMPCDHDFKLIIGVKLRKIDVMGEHLDGRFGLSAWKRPVWIHILARLYENQLVLEGFKPGPQFSDKDQFDWWDSDSIRPLIVYLNCQKAGIDYTELRRRTPPS